MKQQREAITPEPNGTLLTAPCQRLPLGGSRIEAVLEDRGRRLQVGIWGGGRLAGLTLDGTDGDWLVRPNLVRSGKFELALSRTRPALAIRGSGVRWRPAKLPLAGLELPVPNSRARPTRTADGIDHVDLPWGSVAVRRFSAGVVVGVGASPEEALAAARIEPDAIVQEAEAYADDCARLEVDDPLLGSMFAHSLHAALAAVKVDEAGRFAGLAAGPGYSLPPRTYFRDAYWTVPALLPIEPDSVYQTLELLSGGIHSDGEAPSAVITPMQLPEAIKDAIRAHKGTDVSGGEFEHDWWRDHFDSPLMFILMLEEYVAFTGDERPVAAHWDKVGAILERYRRMCPPGSALPLKPYNERDWADNVFRSGLVTYDIGLYHGALSAAARLARGRDVALSDRLSTTAASVRSESRERIWLADRGHYLDYLSDDHAEEHLAIDTLTTVKGGLADNEQVSRILAAVERQLETRNNHEQPYGDFGVMCCYPPYSRRADLKAKSAFPFRYHNGADWPYWDGVYAGLLLERRASGWRYPLTRWWEYSLEQGWATPVEYYSPPYAPGAPLQAWSAMPAASIMQDGFGVKPPFEPRVPPWGESKLRDIVLGGKRGTLVAGRGEVRFEESGPQQER